MTRFWWLVLLLGAAAPVALLAVRGWASGRSANDGSLAGERELLGALREHGELTPTAAAMLTPLTADEAAGMLERLAREGRLESTVGDGAVAYALRDRIATSEPLPETATEDAPDKATPVEPPEEPLSNRELAVLELLADGCTNREIAGRLFIALGTVKAHVASVYRKLGVHTRAEAVSRARDLHLLQ